MSRTKLRLDMTLAEAVELLELAQAGAATGEFSPVAVGFESHSAVVDQLAAIVASATHPTADPFVVGTDPTVRYRHAT